MFYFLTTAAQVAEPVFYLDATFNTHTHEFHLFS